MPSDERRTSTPTHSPARRKRLPVPVLAILAAALAGVLLSACGGSSSDPSAAAAERSQEAQAEAKLVDFARCLREHGVNAETAAGPNGGHGIKISPGKAGPGQGVEAAQKACARYQPAQKKINLSPQQKVEQEEAVQKFARCMREHGIKVEASTQGGGIQIAVHVHRGVGGGPNPESPGFQEAQNNCQKLLPKPPGGASKSGGPGPETSSSTSSGTEGGGAAAGS